MEHVLEMVKMSGSFLARPAPFVAHLARTTGTTDPSDVSDRY